MSADSNVVFGALQQIAQTRGTKAKQALVEQCLAHPLFKRVVVATVNPFITYGIHQMPEVVTGFKGGRVFDESTFELLDRLATRKLTGSAAQEAVAVVLSSLAPESAELLRRILIKDLRAGFSEATLNKIEPGLVPTWACMRAKEYTLESYLRLAKKHRKQPWPAGAEIKYDGLRTQLVVGLASDSVEGSVKAYSRNGLELPALKGHYHSVIQLARMAQKLLMPEEETFVFEAEGEHGDGSSFNDTSSALRKKNAVDEKSTLRVFDLVTWGQFTEKQNSPPQWERRLMLSTLLEKFSEHHPQTRLKLSEGWEVNSDEELQELLQREVARGREGLMLKAPFGVYEPRKSPFWMKLKPQFTEDLLVVDLYEGEPGSQFEGMLGGFIVDRRGVLVRIGGGYSVQDRAQYWADHTGNPVPFRVIDPGTCEEYEVLCGPRDKEMKNTVIEVNHFGVTEAGSLRHPSFVKERPDLRPEDVDGNK